MENNKERKKEEEKESLVQELWNELIKGKLRAIDLIYIIQHIEALRGQAWRTFKNQKSFTNYELLLVMRIAQDDNCDWLLNKAWQVLKNNDPKKEILIYVAKYIKREAIKKEAREILEAKNPTEEELESLEVLKSVGYDVKKIKKEVKDGRNTILAKFKKLYTK